MSQDTRGALKVFQDTAKQIRDLEDLAAKAAQNGDKQTHRIHLTAKCLLLQELPEKVKEVLAGHYAPDAKELIQAAQGFAKRGAQALSVDSVFYMYALLYPEDHKKGEPNDLERFIRDFLAGQS